MEFGPVAYSLHQPKAAGMRPVAWLPSEEEA